MKKAVAISMIAAFSIMMATPAWAQITGISGASGSQKYYYYDAPAGLSKLEIKIAGGTGDCDLYVKYGSQPTTSSYNYRPYLSGNNETVAVNNPSSGRWYIMLRGYSAYSGVTLSVATWAGSSRVATPTVNPGSGSYLYSQNVTISCSTAGATIRYTINGSEPTSSSTQYTGPISVDSSRTIKAKAFKSGMAESYTASATYTISAPSATTLINGQTVSSLSGSAGNEKFYKISVPSGQTKLEIKTWGGSGDCDLYVKRGSQASASSYDYRPYLSGNDETVAVNNPASGDWYIMLSGYNAYSGLSLQATYATASSRVATPTFSSVGGTYSSAQNVTISCSTVGATIRYTTNGSEPTSSSPQYTGPITVNSTTAIKAKAFKAGMTESYTASATYTINAPSATVINNNAPVKNLSDAQWGERYYKITVPSGQDNLTIKISGGSGDCDLYVRRGALPATSTYDFRPYLGGNNESVSVNSPASGDWYVMLRGYSAYSGVSLHALYKRNYSVALDPLSVNVLTVGTPATIRGMIKRNGIAVPNATFGVHNGIRQQSHLVTTDSSGRFSVASTPIVAQSAIVEFLADGLAFGSVVYQVLPSNNNPSSLVCRELRFRNSTARTIKLRATNPYGGTLNYTVAPGQTQTIVSRNSPAFTFKPTTYAGNFATGGIGVADITGTMSVDTSGVATWSVTAGAGVMLRFSIFTTSELDSGVCWSPGGTIGAGAGAEIGADLCIGTSGFSVGGSVGGGLVTGGFSVQLIEW